MKSDMNPAAPRRTARAHWPQIAGQWNLVGSPLRPSAEDISLFAATMEDMPKTTPAPRALVLGVTPELYGLAWPEGTSILAVDHTRAMINALWPGPSGSALEADWTKLPLPPASRDIALCDGGLHLVGFPAGQREMVSRLHKILAERGVAAFRLFASPAERESAAAVLEDLFMKRVPSLNVLKIRLGMALQENPVEGIRLGRVWEVLHRAAPDFNALAGQVGWPLDHLLVINTYHGSSKRYHFVSLEQACRLFCEEPGGFDLVRTVTPSSYALSERCPIVVFRRCR